jgi:hypothetical protein
MTETERVEQLFRQRAEAAGTSVDEVRAALIAKDGLARWASRRRCRTRAFPVSESSRHIQGYGDRGPMAARAPGSIDHGIDATRSLRDGVAGETVARRRSSMGTGSKARAPIRFSSRGCFTGEFRTSLRTSPSGYVGGSATMPHKRWA